MKLINVEEIQDIYKDNRQIKVATNIYINLDQILFIRETSEGVSIFMSGREKPIVINNVDQIKKLYNECKISPKTLNEG